MSWTDWIVACLRAASKQEMLSCQISSCRCPFAALVAEHAGGVTLGYLRQTTCRAADKSSFLQAFAKCSVVASVLHAARSN